MNSDLKSRIKTFGQQNFSPLGNYVAVGMKVRSAQMGDTRLIEFFKLDSEDKEPASTLFAAHNLQCQFVINAIAFMPG